jgi:hypothetical protein
MNNNIIYHHKPKNKVIKTRLSNIIKNDKLEIVSDVINDVVNRINKLTIFSYQFIRCYVLYCYENNIAIPVINEEFVTVVFKVLSKEKQCKDLCKDVCGDICKGKCKDVCNAYTSAEDYGINKKKILEKLDDFYYKYRKSMNIYEKIDTSHISTPLKYIATEIVTNIKNNIIEHYLDHLDNFINSITSKEYNELIKKKNEYYNHIRGYTDINFKGDNRMLEIRQFILEHYKKLYTEVNNKLKLLKKEIYLVKKDIINITSNVHAENTVKLVSDKKYHKFIMSSIDIIRPKLPQIKQTSRMTNIDYYEAKKKQLIRNIIKDPFTYLKYMIIMNKRLEQKNNKIKQILPLRTNVTSKYIKIDTQSLIYLFNYNKSKDSLKTVEERHYVWSQHFDLDNKIMKPKNYKFDYMITTDGYSVSINFLIDEEFEKSLKNKKKKRDARNKTKQENKLLSAEDKQKKNDIKAEKNKNFKDQKRIGKHKTNIEIKDEIEKNNNKKKDIFNKLNDEEKQLYLIKKNIESLKNQGQQKLIYIHKLKKEQLEALKTRNLVVIDPGKNTLLTMLGKPLKPDIVVCNHKYKKHVINKVFYCNRCKDRYFRNKEEKILRYTKAQRLVETKRKYFKNKREKFMKKYNLTNMESKLTGTDKDGHNIYNSKSCSLEKFMVYTKRKNLIMKLTYELYQRNIFKQLRWYSYINTQKSKHRLMNKIRKTYGSKCVLIMGDWSSKMSKQLKGSISTPMIGLKNTLRKYFDVIDIDEYNTSKINYLTKEENKKLKINISMERQPKKRQQRLKKNLKENGKLEQNIIIERKPQNRQQRLKEIIKEKELNIERKNILYASLEKPIKEVKLHSVLTYKMLNNRLGCINRDINAVKNMKNIVQSILKTGNRPVEFTRKSANQKSSRTTNISRQKTTNISCQS